MSAHPTIPGRAYRVRDTLLDLATALVLTAALLVGALAYFDVLVP